MCCEPPRTIIHIALFVVDIIPSDLDTASLNKNIEKLTANTKVECIFNIHATVPTDKLETAKKRAMSVV